MNALSNTDWILISLIGILFLWVISLTRFYRRVSQNLGRLERFDQMISFIFEEEIDTHKEAFIERMLKENEAQYSAARRSGGAALSDLRLKKNIEPVENGLITICGMKPVKFEFKGDNPYKLNSKVRYGFIAQELREVLPDAVVENEDGYLCIDYDGVTSLLVKAVKELRLEVQELRAAQLRPDVREPVTTQTVGSEE
jgi:hypothetical protein